MTAMASAITPAAAGPLPVSRRPHLNVQLSVLDRLNLQAAEAAEECVGLLGTDRLRQYFRELARQRRTHADALASVVGEHNEIDGDVAGASHLAWEQVKAASASGEPRRILRQLFEADQLLLAEYSEGLHLCTDAMASRMLRRQAEAIRSLHSYLCDEMSC